MKKHLLFAILIFLTSPIFSQQTINGSITHGQGKHILMLVDLQMEVPLTTWDFQ